METITPAETKPQSQKAQLPITHIVLIKFKDSVDSETVSDICNSALALKDKCIHPTSKQPYIRSIKGGTDNSPEGKQGGITHVFIMEFESAEDRDYYCNDDPAHAELKKALGAVVEKVQCVDFTDLVFVDEVGDGKVLQEGEVRYGIGGYQGDK